MMTHTLLIVDDRDDNLSSMSLAFARSPYQVLTARDGRKALEILQAGAVDVVLTDLKMPDVDGMELLHAAKELSPSPAVLMVTAFGTVDSAVEALKEGAVDYITKPVHIKELRAKVDKAMEAQRLRRENEDLRTQLKDKFQVDGIIGETPVIRGICQQTIQIAPTRANVLIEGESGTGKELLARALHFNSPRAKKSFVALHCAALSESLLESELFGHEKGAFTGAVARRIGRFELADGGTLFLDEVGEIPLSMQVKLLRVLETREFMRVGGQEAITVDVRLVAATNKNLEEEVKAGRFREDLFYRLKVVSFRLPPLRERKPDIPILVRHFVKLIAKENNKPTPEITPEAMQRLVNHPWTGNVRELRNVIESTIVFLNSAAIRLSDLPPTLEVEAPAEGAISFPQGLSLEQVEMEFIKRTLDAEGGNRTRAAKALGISRRTLQRKLKELGLPD
ncbi:MAG: sigma-54 dependent transcriptional regulator [bacterium]